MAASGTFRVKTLQDPGRCVSRTLQWRTDKRRRRLRGSPETESKQPRQRFNTPELPTPPSVSTANEFEERSMSITNGETAMKDMASQATYQRLEKDISAVKNDIAALTDQITDAINTLASAAKKQARRGYKDARANVDSAIDDASARGGAMLDAAQDAAVSLEETLEDVITQRPLAAVGLALGIGFLIGVTWRR
jgi:ElaB/YqjD/DUF883 family membrane-anchored ribosome-binding protein